MTCLALCCSPALPIAGVSTLPILPHAVRGHARNRHELLCREPPQTPLDWAEMQCESPVMHVAGASELMPGKTTHEHTSVTLTRRSTACPLGWPLHFPPDGANTWDYSVPSCHESGLSAT